MRYSKNLLLSIATSLMLCGISIPAAAVNNCTTGAKAAAQIWNEYGKVIKPLGCAAGAAGASILSGGVALPASAATFATCIQRANKADKATKGMIKAWNNLNKNGWGTIGNRDMRMGGSYKGAVPSVGTRMWIMSAPVTDPFVRVQVKKRDGGWNNAAATRVTVCSFPPEGPGVDESGEKIWSYEFASGKDNQGKEIERVFAVPGTLLTVAFKGKSVAKNFKYRLDLERVGNVDHDVVIAGEAKPGATNYELEASGGLVQVQGNFLNGYKATIDDNDRVQSHKAWGRVGSGNDAFAVAGDIEKLELEDETAARVFVDGEPWGEKGTDHTIVIDGSTADGGSDYVIHGGGELKQVRGDFAGHKVTIQSNDNVNGDRAEGYIGGGKDGYRVTGKLPAVSLDNPENAAVYVNGKRYHTVVIDGSAASGGTDYKIEGGDEVIQLEGSLAGHEVTIQSNDQVSGNRAEGHVGAGKDGFIVLGDRPDVTLSTPANAAVYIDGELQ